MPRTLRLPALASLALAALLIAVMSLVWAPAQAWPWAGPVAVTLLATFVLLNLVLGPRQALAIYIVGVLALALAGCGTMQGMAPEDRRAVLAGAAEHIEKCDRDYWANTGLPGSAGFRITCRQPQDPAELAKAVATAVKSAVAEALAASAETPPPASPK